MTNIKEEVVAHEDADMAESTYLFEELYPLKKDVVKAIEAIKEFKLQQRSLYRDFYKAKEKMDIFMESHKDSKFKKTMDKFTADIDTSQIFYKGYKKRKVEDE